MILTRQDLVRWWMQEYDVLCKCKILNLWGKKPGANLGEHLRALVVWEAVSAHMCTRARASTHNARSPLKHTYVAHTDEGKFHTH